MTTALAAAASLVSGAAASETRLDWIAGYWLACSGEGQTSEVWIGEGSGLLVGASHYVSSGGGASFEHARIGPADDGRLAFFASPGGAAAVAFPLVSTEGETAVFENAAHDFPQRVIYQRSGSTLIGRIEGTVDAAPRSKEWRYQLAQFGEQCR
jgi:hypothetical protein